MQGVEVYPIDTLASLIHHLRGTTPLARHVGFTSFDVNEETVYPVAFEDVKGQNMSKYLTDAGVGAA